MRIAILVYSLTGGGAERVAALWARGFAEHGHQVTVVIFNDHLPVSYALPDGVQLRSIVSHKTNGVFRVLERMWKLRRLLRQEKSEVVIDVIPSLERILSRIGLGCCNISTEHDSFERPENAKEKLEWFTKFYVNRLYNHVTVLTQADKDVIGNRLRHVTVMPNPLVWEPASSVLGKENVVMAVGRKDAWFAKGFDVLIRAWRQVAIDTADWRLLIVGGSSGDGQAYLERLCKECDVADSVVFPNYHSNIQPYYNQASIFVLSSRYEGFGLVLIEAMSQGCACVACDYKGRQSEIVTNGVDGLTCEPDNVDALAGAIRLLIADEEMRSSLQANAIRRAADYKLDRIMERWERVINVNNNGNGL